MVLLTAAISEGCSVVVVVEEVGIPLRMGWYTVDPSILYFNIGNIGEADRYFRYAQKYLEKRWVYVHYIPLTTPLESCSTAPSGYNLPVEWLNES